MAEIYGYTVITPLTVMLTHLSETIKKHAYELLNRSETLQLVENLKKTEPELVADVIPNVISYANLEKILRSLLREGHSHPGSGGHSGGGGGGPVPRPMRST